MPFCGKNHKNSRSFGVQNHFRHFLGTFLGVQKNFCCSARRILGFKSIFIVSPKHFHPSKVFLRPIRGVFSLQKFFCCSARRILGFKRTFIASPKRFHLSKVLLRLPRSDFGFQKCFCASSKAFCRKALPCLPTFCLLAMLAFLPLCGKNHKNSRLLRQKAQKFAFILCVFTLQKRFQFDSDKNHHTVRSFYGYG